MIRYFLKIFWREDFDEVTKKQYDDARRYAGVHIKKGEALIFQGNGISGQIEITD